MNDGRTPKDSSGLGLIRPTLQPTAPKLHTLISAIGAAQGADGKPDISRDEFRSDGPSTTYKAPVIPMGSKQL